MMLMSFPTSFYCLRHATDKYVFGNQGGAGIARPQVKAEPEDDVASAETVPAAGLSEPPHSGAEDSNSDFCIIMNVIFVCRCWVSLCVRDD